MPDFVLPDEEQQPIGVWGQRHKDYLLHHHKVRYYNLLASGKLGEYLAGISKQAEGMYEKLIKQLAEQEGVTEQLKAKNQMLWVRKMNSIRQIVMEIVNTDLIFS